MADLHAQLLMIETAEPPDLWAGIEARAREERPEMDGRITSVVAFRGRAAEQRRRLAAGLLAAAVVAATAMLAWQVFRDATTIQPLPPGGATLPEGWERCTNDVFGYSIGYPGEWHTTDVFDGETDPANACKWFSPEPFGPEGNLVSEGWGYPLEVAIGGTIDEEFLELRALEAQVLLEKPAVVDGHRATRVEYSVEFDPVADPGRHYQYMIELDAETTLLVHTTETRGIVGEYDENKAVVDDAVDTLRFAETSTGS